MSWNEMERARKEGQPCLSYSPGIWLGGLRKITKYLRLIRNKHLTDTKLLEWNEMERARKEG
jgi:hypothetical protein